MNGTKFHPARFTLFVILSGLDLLLTYRLIHQTDGMVYESNPLAEAWLANYGWAGLAFFKLGMVFIVLSAAVLVARTRPRVGGHLLTFACAAVASVVLYSYSIAKGPAISADSIKVFKQVTQQQTSFLVAR